MHAFPTQYIQLAIFRWMKMCSAQEIEHETPIFTFIVFYHHFISMENRNHWGQNWTIKLTKIEWNQNCFKFNTIKTIENPEQLGWIDQIVSNKLDSNVCVFSSFCFTIQSCAIYYNGWKYVSHLIHNNQTIRLVKCCMHFKMWNLSFVYIIIDVA